MLDEEWKPIGWRRETSVGLSSGPGSHIMAVMPTLFGVRFPFVEAGFFRAVEIFALTILLGYKVGVHS